MSFQAFVYVLLCVFLWSLIPVVAKFGQTDLDNHQFLFYSSIISFFTFVVICVVTRKAKLFLELRFSQWLNGAFLGFLGTYLYYILLYFGYAHIRGLEVLVIQYSWPMWVVILSVIILKEKLTLNKVLSLILGFIGVFFVLTKGNFSELTFENLSIDFIVIIGALAFALFSVLSKKVKMDAIVLVTLYFLSSSIFSVLGMFYFSEFTLPSQTALMPVFLNGVFVNGISYIFWIKALSIGQASFVAPFVFLTPIVSAILLVLLFNEPFLNVYIIGMLLVLTAGLVNSIRNK